MSIRDEAANLGFLRKALYMIIQLEQADVEKIERLLSCIVMENKDRDLIRIVKSIRLQIDEEEN